MAYCSDFESKNTVRDACSGDGCCQSAIPRDIKYYRTRAVWNANDGDPSGLIRDCTYAFVGEQDTFRYNRSMNYSSDPTFIKRVEDNIPVVLDWAISNLSCAEASATTGYACQSNSICVDAFSGGYRCQCKEGGYEGNPYLSPGCRGMGLALPTIVIVLLILCFIALKRRLKEKYYQENGGAILKDILKSKGGVSVNNFRVEELKEATNNFSKVIGKGGHGTVYMGTLKETGQPVAIKESKIVDEKEREDFLNEMVILTQINHTNVVQLIGFCLETKVPLLVYEFIPNENLYHHIHNTNTERLSLDARLKIAYESAGALAYLHTDARLPIIHRDVKSANILLDESFTAKVADFGASRLVPLGHAGINNKLIEGTLGYLDPEYFRTAIFTDKSDVYSFGVVLAELLTGQQPINLKRRPGEQNLAINFLKAVKNDNFVGILEEGMVTEATLEQLKTICDLVCKCLNPVSEDRPSMKEVMMELDNLRKWVKQTNGFSGQNYIETSSDKVEIMEPTFHSIILSK
uniref:wall-associated receptor kinase 1-like n=1 Tax=Erigeron canadensis TaxID=72917 RepID=UPI001CB92A7F|nr:wall-associated receptor kinase 1-like [Erigeron canadensis]